MFFFFFFSGVSNPLFMLFHHLFLCMHVKLVKFVKFCQKGTKGTGWAKPNEQQASR